VSWPSAAHSTKVGPLFHLFIYIFLLYFTQNPSSVQQDFFSNGLTLHKNAYNYYRFGNGHLIKLKATGQAGVHEPVISYILQAFEGAEIKACIYLI